MIAGRHFESEFTFNATRSSGPGGQNVNKVSTRVELRFDLHASKLLNDYEKELIATRLVSKITKEGVLIVVSQAARSQFENKEKSVEKFYKLLTKALTPVKKRKKTEPTTASRVRRLEGKKLKSRKKTLRRPASEE
jgi:ribosome-associated protein